MPFADPPNAACWQHRGLRSGFEVVYFEAQRSGWRIEGTTVGFQDGEAWVVSCDLETDEQWRTRSAHVTAKTVSGVRERLVEADGEGHWWIDGVEATHLDGCVDIDLESSAMTNTLPVRRLGLSVGERADVPASYLRVAPSTLDRLEQSYLRIEDVEGRQQYVYAAPAFEFECHLVYEDSGLVLEYPGIATRVA
jgi:uncharacterized protein